MSWGHFRYAHPDSSDKPGYPACLWQKLLHMVLQSTLKGTPTYSNHSGTAFYTTHVASIDIHGRSQKMCHLDAGMGLKLGVFGLFPYVIKIPAVGQARMPPASTAV